MENFITTEQIECNRIKDLIQSLSEIAKKEAHHLADPQIWATGVARNTSSNTLGKRLNLADYLLVNATDGLIDLLNGYYKHGTDDQKSMVDVVKRFLARNTDIHDLPQTISEFGEQNGYVLCFKQKFLSIPIARIQTLNIEIE